MPSQRDHAQHADQSADRCGGDACGQVAGEPGGEGGGDEAAEQEADDGLAVDVAERADEDGADREADEELGGVRSADGDARRQVLCDQAGAGHRAPAATANGIEVK